MDQERIGELIKKIRKENNLTQAELADKLGVTYQAVSKWENGKNIPDIAILKQISNEFNINLDDLLNGNHVITPKKRKGLLIGGIALFSLIIVTIILLIIGSKTDLLIKKVTTYDSNFEIVGTVAKSNGKTYIYISDIEYKDEEDDTIYDSVRASLYEEYKGKSTKIDTTELEEVDTTLREYLKKVTFNIDDYKSDCKDLTKAKLYLEIEVTQEGKNTYFKIPLELEDICPDK